MSPPSLADMHAFAALTARALLDPRGAARGLLALAVSAEFLLRLLDFALLTDAELQAFEATGDSYLLQAPEFGRLWLAPPGRKRLLLPPAPTFSPRALRALARGLVDEAAA